MQALTALRPITITKTKTAMMMRTIMMRTIAMMMRMKTRKNRMKTILNNGTGLSLLARTTLSRRIYMQMAAQ